MKTIRVRIATNTHENADVFGSERMLFYTCSQNNSN